MMKRPEENKECSFEVFNNNGMLDEDYVNNGVVIDLVSLKYDPRQIPEDTYEEISKPIEGSWEDMGR